MSRGTISVRKAARLVTLIFPSIVSCVLTPPLSAQSMGSVPFIRVEAHQVLVPTLVFATHNGNGYNVEHLNVADFQLFEDGKEANIEKVKVERAYTMVFDDNAGFQGDWSFTSKSKWSRLSSSSLSWGEPSVFYVLAYTPPPSPDGSCHKIRVKVSPRDASGSRLVQAEFTFVFAKGPQTERVEVDRRDLSIYSRAEYCKTPNPSLDALSGTKVGKQMEEYPRIAKGNSDALFFQAVPFYREADLPRVRFTLDFPRFGNESGVPSFPIDILGMAYTKSGTLASRFSDSNNSGCWVLSGIDARTYPADLCRESIPNHYEAQIQLPPGNYDLRVVMNYDGKLGLAQLPLTVDNYDHKRLAVSGIAFCKRYHVQKDQVLIKPESQVGPPTMLLELDPLVSKGIEFTPTGDTRFAKSDHLIAYFEIYEPLLTDAPSTSVRFQMRITDEKTGEVKTDTGLRTADSFVQPGKTVIPISEQVAITELPSGNYRLEVQASDSTGDKTEWRTTSFTVD